MYQLSSAADHKRVFNQMEIGAAAKFIQYLADGTDSAGQSVNAIPPYVAAGYKSFGEALSGVKTLTGTQLEQQLLSAAESVSADHRASLIDNLRAKFLWAAEQGQARGRSPS